MVCFNTFHLERRQPNMYSITIMVIMKYDDYAEYDDYVEYEKNHWQKKLDIQVHMFASNQNA